jgi:hypothetical protein
MSGQLFDSVLTIATAIVGLAVIAVLVSRNANTSGVISAATSGFGYDIGAAVAPVTGNQPMAPFSGFSGGIG